MSVNRGCLNMEGVCEQHIQNDSDYKNSHSPNNTINGRKLLENDFTGGREVSVGHFSEEDSFPAKAPLMNVIHDHVIKSTYGQEKKQFQLMEDDSEPNTVGNLNITPRQQVCIGSVVDSIKALDVKGDFLDKTERSKCLWKFGVQEENIISDSYKSQFVISGSRVAVSSLLSVHTKLIADTHGVIVDHTLRPSPYGRYEEHTEFEVIKRIGKGGFGEVDLCRHKSGKKYVTKRMFGKFKEKEVQVLMSLHHTNITSFLGYIKRNGVHEILMEYGGMSLKAFVDTQDWRSLWSVEVVMTLAVQGFTALQYMHEFGILHLDVKPENVCIYYESACNPVMKLTDFGTSKTPEQPITHDGWTPEYMSPEACQSIMVSQRPDLSGAFKQYDLTGKADVFAFGLTLYFMLEGSHAVIDIWRKQITPETFAAVRPTFIFYLAQCPHYICERVTQMERPQKVTQLLSQVLAGYPDQRLTAEEACHWIQKALNEEVGLPTILPLDSPGSQTVDMSDNLTTSQSIINPATSNDISLRKLRPPGGGKDIKNHLRQKILRRQSTGPYQRQESLRATSRVERLEVMEQQDNDMSLPVFSALLDD